MKYDRAKRHRLTIEKKKLAEKGLLEQLMLQASRKFDVPLYELKIGTIQGCTKPTRKLICTDRDPLRPMHEVEAHLIKVILLRRAMLQPVRCAEGLQLENSIIEGTVYQVQLIQWKATYLGNNYNEETTGQMGQKYWRNLCDRHEREIE
jgi:hypothetical protein